MLASVPTARSIIEPLHTPTARSRPSGRGEAPADLQLRRTAGAQPPHDPLPHLHSYTRTSLKQRHRPRTTNRLPPGRSTRSTRYCSPSALSATPDTIAKVWRCSPRKPPAITKIHPRQELCTRASRDRTRPRRAGYPAARHRRPGNPADLACVRSVLELCWLRNQHQRVARFPPGRISAGQDNFSEPVSGFEPLTCRLQDGCSAN
jgi:hypothetical protein